MSQKQSYFDALNRLHDNLLNPDLLQQIDNYVMSLEAAIERLEQEKEAMQAAYTAQKLSSVINDAVIEIEAIQKKYELSLYTDF